MCQYRIITFSCGHTIHSKVRNSQCSDIPCSTSTPIMQITTYFSCPPCNGGEGTVQGHNLPRRRNAQINPSDVAAAIARENARVRRARNISVPEPASAVIPPPSASYTYRYSSRAFANAEAAQRVAYGIPGNIGVGKQAVDHTIRNTHSLSGGWRRGIVVFLFNASLFCFLLCTFLFLVCIGGWFYD